MAGVRVAAGVVVLNVLGVVVHVLVALRGRLQLVAGVLIDDVASVVRPRGVVRSPREGDGRRRWSCCAGMRGGGCEATRVTSRLNGPSWAELNSNEHGSGELGRATIEGTVVRVLHTRATVASWNTVHHKV